MATDMQPAVAPNESFAPLSLDIQDLIIDVYPLGGRRDKKRYPGQVYAQVGRVVVASHDGEVNDQDKLPEVYMPGEKIAKAWYQRRPCLIAEMAEYPGTIRIEVTQPLVGIPDTAIARFTYPLRLHDPIRLLRRDARWMNPDGAERLRRNVIDLIQAEARTILLNIKEMRLWSHPDLHEVAGSLFVRLDGQLDAWGIRLDSKKITAYRRLPQQLYEVALEFKAAERYLLDERDPFQKRQLLAEWKLQDIDLADIREPMARLGEGAGLFLTARRNRDCVPDLSKWLEKYMGLHAAWFLREMCSDKNPVQDVALTEQVILSAFKFPMLGLGEWGDTESNLIEAARYRQLEAYLKAPVSETP
jgi:hypothetical protein